MQCIERKDFKSSNKGALMKLIDIVNNRERRAFKLIVRGYRTWSWKSAHQGERDLKDNEKIKMNRRRND